jgi:hypothetical protein
MADKTDRKCIVTNLNFKNKFEETLNGYRISVAASLLRSILVLRRILKFEYGVTQTNIHRWLQSERERE